LAIDHASRNTRRLSATAGTSVRTAILLPTRFYTGSVAPVNALTVLMKSWSGQVARRSALSREGRARAQMMLGGRRRSPRRAQVAIEPVEDFLHHQVVRGKVTRLGDHVALVR